VASIQLCSFLGVFRGRTLALAPARQSQLTLLLFGAVALLYLGAGIAAGNIFYARHPEMVPNSAPAAATPNATAPATAASAGPSTTGAPATNTSTAPATATTTASAPATESAETAQLHAPTAILVEKILFDCTPPIAAALLVLMLVRGRVVRGIAGLGLAPAGIGQGILYALLAAFIMAPWLQVTASLTEVLMQVLHSTPPPVHPMLEMAKSAIDPTLLAAILLSGIVVAPACEEILFRGLLQTALLTTFRMIPADEADGNADREFWFRLVSISITAAFFAIIHAPIEGWESFGPLFVLAVTLGYVYERTGNLWAPIALHALFNTLGFSMVFLSGGAR